MEFVLPVPKWYSYRYIPGDDDWIYLGEEESYTFDKINVITGEVISLAKLPGAPTGNEQ